MSRAETTELATSGAIEPLRVPVSTSCPRCHHLEPKDFIDVTGTLANLKAEWRCKNCKYRSFDSGQPFQIKRSGTFASIISQETLPGMEDWYVRHSRKLRPPQETPVCSSTKRGGRPSPGDSMAANAETTTGATTSDTDRSGTDRQERASQAHVEDMPGAERRSRLSRLLKRIRRLAKSNHHHEGECDAEHRHSFRQSWPIRKISEASRAIARTRSSPKTTPESDGHQEAPIEATDENDYAQNRTDAELQSPTHIIQPNQPTPEALQPAIEAARPDVELPDATSEPTLGRAIQPPEIISHPPQATMSSQYDPQHDPSINDQDHIRNGDSVIHGPPDSLHSPQTVAEHESAFREEELQRALKRRRRSLSLAAKQPKACACGEECSFCQCAMQSHLGRRSRPTSSSSDGLLHDLGSLSPSLLNPSWAALHGAGGQFLSERHRPISGTLSISADSRSTQVNQDERRPSNNTTNTAVATTLDSQSSTQHGTTPMEQRALSPYSWDSRSLPATSTFPETVGSRGGESDGRSAPDTGPDLEE